MKEQKAHILVIDDDSEIRLPLARYLGKNGFAVTSAINGREMDGELAKTTFDLIVLDILMPGEDGFSICRRLQESTRIPIILLSALVEETDKIVGLELGADDYVTKPFIPRELLARIKSVIRRSTMLPPRQRKTMGIVQFEGWNFNFSQKEVIGEDGVIVRLSSSEHILLISFIEHAGVTLSRDQLLNLTKGREAQLFDRSIDIQISRLRRKLEQDAKNPRIIVTVWGGGYQFSSTINWSES